MSKNTALTSLGGLSALQWVRNPTSAFPDGYLSITENPSLTSLGLSALQHAGSYLEVRNNAALPTCYVDLLVSQLSEAAWTGSRLVSGNNDAGVCL